MRREHRLYVIALLGYLLAAGFIASGSFGFVALFAVIATSAALSGMFIEARDG